MDNIRKRISCQRCRNRKLKCSRTSPCSACTSSSAECIFRVDDARRRPVGRGYVTALEEKISSYEALLRDLEVAPAVERDRILSRALADPYKRLGDVGVQSTDDAVFDYTGSSRLATMSIRCGPQGVPSFYGPTSIYQEDMTAPYSEVSSSIDAHRYLGHWQDMRMHLNLGIEDSALFKSLSLFFAHQHSQCPFIDPVTFLQDYLKLDHGGQYWSYPLLYAICALGAKASSDGNLRKDAQRLCHISQEMLNTPSPGMQYPDLTVIQALLCCAVFELSAGNHSKGWMLSGMAFRMVQDLGFHQDPRFVVRDGVAGNTASVYEMRRRIYWGCYIADKIISLYFGRPVFLHAEDAAVNPIDPIILIHHENSSFDIPELEATANFPEDQATFITTFTHLTDLCTIIEDILTQIFSTRLIKKPRKELVLTRLTRLGDLNIRLFRWNSELPQTIAWNQWKPASHSSTNPHVLFTHALYHSTLIALNRNFIRPTPGFARKEQSKEICLSSADNIIALVRQYRAKSPLCTAPVVLLYSVIMAASALSLSGGTLEGAFGSGDASSKSSSADDSRVLFVLKALGEFAKVHPVAGLVGRQLSKVFESGDRSEALAAITGHETNVQRYDGLEGRNLSPGFVGSGQDETAGIAGTLMDAGAFGLMTWDFNDLDSGDLGDLLENDGLY